MWIIHNLSKPIFCSNSAIILSKLLISRRNYCKTIFNTTGVNSMWIIDNNVPILERIKHLSNNHKAVNISTFDFSTLYTSIPLDDLKDNSTNFVNEIFNKTPKF